MTTRHRKYLNQFLGVDVSQHDNRSIYGTPLKIAVLRALQQIGDETALSVVEKLAESAKDMQVRHAAEECLPFLRQRTGQLRLEQTLLRASGPGTPPEVLLRPANYGEEAAPQQLLRASKSDEQ